MNTLLHTALTAVKEAGDAIFTLYGVADFEMKGDGSPVTIADTRSHDMLVTHLEKTGISILSEESESVPLPYPEQMWIIDPLDGTKDFLKHTHDFSVMVGLLQNGKPILGVVYAPALNVLYYAEKGQGAYQVRDGVTTQLSVEATHRGPLRFLCSVNNFAPYMETVTEMLSAVKTPRGSVGVKAGIIGENQGEFFFNRGKLGEWDVCAPEIILEEAGGRVTDCNGDALVYGSPDHRIAHGILFSNGACHEEVLTAIQKTK